LRQHEIRRVAGAAGGGIGGPLHDELAEHEEVRARERDADGDAERDRARLRERADEHEHAAEDVVEPLDAVEARPLHFASSLRSSSAALSARATARSTLRNPATRPSTRKSSMSHGDVPAFESSHMPNRTPRTTAMPSSRPTELADSAL